jgi:ubiquinone/menaquinone biosynthesis C-methylase UbiE
MGGGDTSAWPERRFLLQLIQTYGQPVLDVGCGTGRLLLDYLGQGIDGMDNSPAMLALCRHKATTLGINPTLYEQYLETMSLPRQYRMIMITSSTLQLVIEPGTHELPHAHTQGDRMLTAASESPQRPVSSRA